MSGLGALGSRRRDPRALLPALEYQQAPLVPRSRHGNLRAKRFATFVEDRKSTRLNSSHTVIFTLSLHDALPISKSKIMPIAIRKLFGLTLFLQILCLDSAPLARAEEIRVLYYPPWNISKLPLYLARDTGIFERSGLQLSWKIGRAHV